LVRLHGELPTASARTGPFLLGYHGHLVDTQQTRATTTAAGSVETGTASTRHERHSLRAVRRGCLRRTICDFDEGEPPVSAPRDAIALPNIAGADTADAGTASGLVNTFHQLGSALGLGVLVTVGIAGTLVGASPTDALVERVDAALTGASACSPSPWCW
jgi:hypothetical protein